MNPYVLAIPVHDVRARACTCVGRSVEIPGYATTMVGSSVGASDGVVVGSSVASVGPAVGSYDGAAVPGYGAYYPNHRSICKYERHTRA